MLDRRVLVPALAALAAALLAAACGKDSNGGTGAESSARSFQATVTGDLSASLSGPASFAEGMLTPAGGSGWVLSLIIDEESGAAISIARLSARPGEGTHGIVDMSDFDAEGPASDAIFAVFLYSDAESQGALLSSGGELRVSQSSANRMQGSFQISAAGALIEGGAVRDVTVAVSGTFDAAR